MDTEKLELLQRFSMLMGPKTRIDRELLKNFLVVLSLIADRDVSDELIKVLQRIS
ncbi:hypothetical protein EDC14_100855 [Hydrogenispora ethanolica]|uniref:Uncharacterized protein n=1 Tax=Hydrogenispora ethanolica TaxID=1082276 RepID=A0A4R1RXK3_HYDET|nr:hypothetical protein EDC14_100855 [Hydrogenispora ethanolica]